MSITIGCDHDPTHMMLYLCYTVVLGAECVTTATCSCSSCNAKLVRSHATMTWQWSSTLYTSHIQLSFPCFFSTLCKHREKAFLHLLWESISLCFHECMTRLMVGCVTLCSSILIAMHLLHHCTQNFPKDASVHLIIKKTFQLRQQLSKWLVMTIACHVITLWL